MATHGQPTPDRRLCACRALAIFALPETVSRGSSPGDSYPDLLVQPTNSARPPRIFRGYAERPAIPYALVGALILLAIVKLLPRQFGGRI